MRELIFDILAIDRASAVFDRVAGSAARTGEASTRSSGVMSKAWLGAGVALTAIAVESIKTSSDMEQTMTKLTSTAGESAAGVKVVWAGVDQLAGQVGYGVKDLGDALYYAESGGYHAADAMTVLTATAKGAKVENANVVEVTHAVTGALRDYNMHADQASTVTNAMNVAVGHGMMTFNDLAEAFPKIGSRAHSANVTLEETLSAMARMTADGLPASVAATYLGQTIGQLAAPTAKASKEMKGLGIDSTALSQTLTSGSGHGLGDAINMVYKGITSHLAPSGLVAVESFRKSKGSASDYQKMLANLPPAMQTTFQALSVMSGGVKSMQGVLMLGGDGLKGYHETLTAVNKSVNAGGKEIDGFNQQQATLNGKIDDVKGAFSGLADELGQQLLPSAKDALDKLTVGVQWMADHRSFVQGFGQVLVGLASGFVAVKTAMMAYSVWQGISTGLTIVAESTFGTYVGVLALEGVSAFKGVVSGIKEWTVVQAILDAELIANPIGLVIVAIAALAAGLIYAYQHSDTFRNIVNTAFHAIATVAQWMWNSVLKPVLGFLLNAFADVAGGAAKMLDAMSSIPGFGWAHDAASALDAMARNARSAADNLNAIPPTKHVDITMSVSSVLTPAGIAAQKAAQAAIPAALLRAGHNATGTSNWRGGLTWVGENGPELVDVPGGSRVHTNAESAKMTQQPANDGPVVVNIYDTSNVLLGTMHGAIKQQARQLGAGAR